MTHRDPARRQRVAVYYTQNHLTIREIATIEQVTPAAVFKHLRAAGVSREDGTWVKGFCDRCKQEMRVGRARHRKSKRHYCSSDCYLASRANPDYKPWRHGQRLGRQVVRALYPALTTVNVVHHHDGNNANNRPANLAVFENQSAHMAYHHDPAGSIQPIWDGRWLTVTLS